MPGSTENGTLEVCSADSPNSARKSSPLSGSVISRSRAPSSGASPALLTTTFSTARSPSRRKRGR